MTILEIPNISRCVYTVYQQNIYLLSLYTYPEYRKRGHASRLLQDLIALGEKNNCKYIFLDDMCEVPVKDNIYYKFGFQIQKQTRQGRMVWVNWKQDSNIIGAERRLLIRQ